MSGQKARSRLGRWGTVLGLYLLAVAMGLVSAWWVLTRAPWSGAVVRVGPWSGSTLAGSPDADLYTRARVALQGLLALGREETIYYVAQQDDQGRPLRTRCRYTVSGTPPGARWWSITAYADDFFLLNVAPGHFSVNSSNLKLDGGGRFLLHTGPQAPDGGLAWLPTPGDRGLVLTLRLYNPGPDLQAAPGGLNAPSIQRTGDCS